MTKLKDLREYLLKNIPGLKRNPDQLITLVRDGRIEFHNGANYSHRYHMPVTVIITDWKGSVDDVVLPVLEWMSVREPDRDPNEAIRFETEIIDNETTDIAFTLSVKERVIVTLENDQRVIKHVLPPVPLQMDKDAKLQVMADDDRRVDEDYQEFPGESPCEQQ